MKIATYNVNGLRAALTKGLAAWVAQEAPDILCFQEVKALPDQVPVADLEAMGYKAYWMPARKKGYSGVATFTKVPPVAVLYGIGEDAFDSEGRLIRLDFAPTPSMPKGFALINAYFPSGTSGGERQDFKYQWLSAFDAYVVRIQPSAPPLLICGDVNICHKEIDIHNPVANKNTSGFLPEERAWVTRFLEGGFVDVFRHFNQEPHQYSWWTYRAGARDRNIGWRIDYFFASQQMAHALAHSRIAPEAKHSDHCPVIAEIRY